MSSPEMGIIEPDMPLIFEAVQMSLDPEDVPSLVMSALHLRKLQSENPDDNPEVNGFMREYDRVWEELSQISCAPPVTEDSRQDLEMWTPIGVDSILSPWAVFQPREQYRTFLKQRRDNDQVILGRTIAASYEALSPNDNTTVADYLLSLVGTRVNDSGDIGFDSVSQEQLEAAREIFAVLSPVFRDMIRISPGFYGQTLDESVAGTDIEDPELRSAYDSLKTMQRGNDE